MKKLIVIFLFNITAFTVPAQLQYIEYGIGASYNFQSNGVGLDLRGEIPINKAASLTPHISYFPVFNTIHEAYLGVDGVYHFIEYKKYRFYAFLGAYYNYWINYDKYDEKVAKKNSFTLEGGVGAEMTARCISPFIENRYSLKWRESYLIIGIKLCMFKCSGKYNVIKCPDF